MAERLPALVLTGASGIVGRSFLEAARDQYRIFAIARRAQSEAGVAYHANIEWIQVDIENAAALAQVTAQIERPGGADFLLHLAVQALERQDHRRQGALGGALHSRARRQSPLLDHLRPDRPSAALGHLPGEPGWLDLSAARSEH